MHYQPDNIEAKWQKHWDKTKLYQVSNQSDKPKYYVLDMFPYPSGSGLHVGHPLGYVASDIYARYKRLKGYNVLHPMGFDNFGLPAEQYAVQTGTHPKESTAKNIAYYKEQLRKLGLSFDWSRQIITSDPQYYKWTQWIVLQLFTHYYDTAQNKARPIAQLAAQLAESGTENVQAACNDDTPTLTASQWQALSEIDQQKHLMNYRLVHLSKSYVNWCEALGCVLANDEVKDGKSERGGHPVERREMTQWFLRVTAYAERLLNNLNGLAWSDAMKEMQRNWIGRSEGASMWFDIADQDEPTTFEVFTTRPDTIFGVTFMVLAPEHELVEKITTPKQKATIDEYLAYAKGRTDLERQQEVKTVTGAFTGAYAIHPFNGEKLPIYISDYVLAGYGTGAIMAVPSDDERDQRFAEKFDIPIIPVVDKSNYEGSTLKDKTGIIINSDFLNGLEVMPAITKAIAAIEAKGIGTKKINYRLRDATLSRQRYWGEPFPVVYKENGMPYPLQEEELPLTLPELSDFKPQNGEPPLSRATDWMQHPQGTLETDTMPGFAGSSWYWLRYMDPHNNERLVGKEAEQYWESVDLYVGGTEHAVGHLIYSRMWNMFLYDVGIVTQEEPYKRLVNQGMIQGRSSIAYRAVDENGENVFVTKSKKDAYNTIPIYVPISCVSDDKLDIECLQQQRPDIMENANFIFNDKGEFETDFEIEKMSKSKLNVVNPDDMVAQYGADCFRMYEMFLGPIEMAKPWNTDGIEGVYKFLKRFWRLFNMDEQGQMHLSHEAADANILKTVHRTIKKVNEDIERLSFNTCISAFMECTNKLMALKSKALPKDALSPLVILIAPFAPYMAEELWHKLGNKDSVHTATYPEHNPAYLIESSITYPVQINGKMRQKIDLPADITQAEAQAIVMQDAKVQEYTTGKTLRKFIFVPKRIINIVVG